MDKYTKQAIDFLNASNCSMAMTFKETVDGFPFDENDTMRHDKYIVTIRRKSPQPWQKKTYSFPFYNCYKAFLEGERPTKYDILACLQVDYFVEDIHDFCSVYGYSLYNHNDDKPTKKIYKNWRKEQDKLKEFFTDTEIEMLNKIWQEV